MPGAVHQVALDYAVSALAAMLNAQTHDPDIQRNHTAGPAPHTTSQEPTRPSSHGPQPPHVHASQVHGPDWRCRRYSEAGAPAAQAGHQLPRLILVQPQGSGRLLSGRILPGIMRRPVPDLRGSHLQLAGRPHGRQR